LAVFLSEAFEAEEATHRIAKTAEGRRYFIRILKHVKLRSVAGKMQRENSDSLDATQNGSLEEMTFNEGSMMPAG
jgi:hypothetical protein